MAKSKIKDFLLAVKDEGVSALLESDEFKQGATTVLEHVVNNQGTAIIAGSIIGAAAPRLNSVILSFKENRFERNTNMALELIGNRLDEIDSRVFTEDQIKAIVSNEIPLFLDSLYEERQSEKVKYHVSAFINSMGQNVDESVLINAYDTINQLTEVDIEILECYIPFSGSDFTSVLQKHGIDNKEYRLIREKLNRFGLLDSKNDDIREQNLQSAVDYISAVAKENKKKNPGMVRTPKFKKTHTTESYNLSFAGRRLLTMTGIYPIPDTKQDEDSIQGTVEKGSTEQ